jgi:hypothetical protein
MRRGLASGGAEITALGRSRRERAKAPAFSGRVTVGLRSGTASEVDQHRPNRTSQVERRAQGLVRRVGARDRRQGHAMANGCIRLRQWQAGSAASTAARSHAAPCQQCCIRDSPGGARTSQTRQPGLLLATSSIRRGHRRRQNPPPLIDAVSAAVVSEAAFVTEGAI